MIWTARLWRGAWKTNGFSMRAQTVGLLVLVGVVPLPLLVLAGMEHAMHAFLAVTFLGAASKVLGEQQSARSLPWLSFLMGAARFEGVFLGAFAALALARQKRFGAAAATVGAAFLPFVLHGLMARSQGWPFVAASVALKSRPPHFSLGGAVDLAGVIVLKWLLIWGCTAMALVAFGLARRQSVPPALRAALPLYGAATLAHVALALAGSFFRYDAYLFALGIAVLWPALVVAFPRERTWKTMPLQLAGLFVVAAWGMRAVSGVQSAAPGTRNIWRQQRQMARFVAECYPRETVAFNDIGATDWASANRTGGRAALDLFGLSERETLRVRLSDPQMVLWPREAQRIVKARGVRLAIIYDSWFEPHLLGPEWTRVARWDCGSIVTSTDRRVSFWTTKDNAVRLRAQLKAFESRLPRGVAVLRD